MAGILDVLHYSDDRSLFQTTTVPYQPSALVAASVTTLAALFLPSTLQHPECSACHHLSRPTVPVVAGGRRLPAADHSRSSLSLTSVGRIRLSHTPDHTGRLRYDTLVNQPASPVSAQQTQSRTLLLLSLLLPHHISDRRTRSMGPRNC